MADLVKSLTTIEASSWEYSEMTDKDKFLVLNKICVIWTTTCDPYYSGIKIGEKNGLWWSRTMDTKIFKIGDCIVQGQWQDAESRLPSFKIEVDVTSIK